MYNFFAHGPVRLNMIKIITDEVNVSAYIYLFIYLSEPLIDPGRFSTELKNMLLQSDGLFIV